MGRACQTCSKEISSNLFLLKEIKKYLPLDARKLFFNSYVLPHFDYCCVIWGNCSQRLVKLQKRAARLILNKDYNTRSHVLFSELGWMPLNDRITFKRAVQVYKCLNENNSGGLSDLFTYNRDVHYHNTRVASKDNLHKERNHAKCVSCLGTNTCTWNNIPPPIRNAKTASNFKTRYQNHYFAEDETLM